MNKKEKAAFIKSCLRTTEKALLSKLDRVPAEWDGHELRAWVVIDVARNIGGFDTIPVSTELKDTRRPRVKAFRNAVIVNNL